MGFSRQEYWSGLLFPSPGDLPDPGIKPRSPTLQADALTSEPPGKPTLQQENRLNEKPRHRNEQRPFTATRKSESEVAQSCPTLHQAPPSMGFSRQEYWSGLLFPSPGNLPNPGIEPRSLALQADSLPSEPLPETTYLHACLIF